MRRHAGWIALHAGIAGGGDVILIPEVAWTYDGICRQIAARDAVGKNFTLIVVAEGAQLPEGDHVLQEAPPAQGQVRLGGIGYRLAAEIEQRLERECRVVVLGHLQRGGGPTPFDRVLATQFAVHAVQLMRDGEYGKMVTYRPPRIESVWLSDAIAKLSRVDPDGPEVRTARSLGISLGDEGSIPDAVPVVRPAPYQSNASSGIRGHVGPAILSSDGVSLNPLPVTTQTIVASGETCS